MPNNGFNRRQIRRGLKPKHKITKAESYVIATYIFFVGALGVSSILFSVVYLLNFLLTWEYVGIFMTLDEAIIHLQEELNDICHNWSCNDVNRNMNFYFYGYRSLKWSGCGIEPLTLIILVMSLVTILILIYTII